MISSGFARPVRILLIALSLGLGIFLLSPLTSEAHAILLKSNPASDAVLTSAPSQVQMWFSEDLNPATSTAQVLNAANNTRVDAHDAHVAANNTKEMDLSIASSIPPGNYIVVWRSQSADDGHVLSSSFIFSVANPDGTVPHLGKVTTPTSLGNSNAATGTLDGPAYVTLLMITLVDLASIFWVAAQFWRVLVLRLGSSDPEEQTAIHRRVAQRFDRSFSLPLLLIMLLANIGILIGQSLSLGGSLGDALNPSTLLRLISSGRFGTFWTLHEVLILVTLGLACYLLTTPEHSKPVEQVTLWANLLLGLGLLSTITLSGHAAAVNNNTIVLSTLSDWLHLIAASLWVGGMIYLALIYLPILKSYPPLERTRSLLSTLPAFSPLAVTGVVIMAISGPFNATVHMNSLNQLLSTAYGRTLTIKVLLVLAMMATSAVHLWLYRPRLKRDYLKYEQAQTSPQAEEEGNGPALAAPTFKTLEQSIGRQEQRLTKTLRWEPLLGVAVIVCTGLLNVLAGTLQPAVPAAPAPTTAVKPFVGTIQTTDKQFTVKLTISPNRFGPNTFSATILDKNGKVATDVGITVYTTMEDMDMGTQNVTLQPDGKGHFSAQADLEMGGHWQIRVLIRTLQNTLHDGTTHLVTPY